MSRSFKTPKGCHVRSVTLTGQTSIASSKAELSIDCGGEGGGGKGWFPTHDGGYSNYQKVRVDRVRSIRLPGSTVTGQGARADFDLIPRHVTCRKMGSEPEIKCTIHNADGTQLSGARRKRRR